MEGKKTILEEIYNDTNIIWSNAVICEKTDFYSSINFIISQSKKIKLC